jgi:hypothetical protein
MKVVLDCVLDILYLYIVIMKHKWDASPEKNYNSSSPRAFMEYKGIIC